MQLRAYQSDAINQIKQSIASGNKRPIVAAPTSFGKTVLAGSIMKSCQDKGNRGWFFCDRIQLIEQSIQKFRSMGIDFGVRQASHPLMKPHAPIQIASIQTVQAMVNKHKRNMPVFDIAMVDEAHTQYDIIKQIISEYNNTPIIGLTATPYSKGLGKIYTNLINPITTRELESQGFLCPVRYYGGEHIDLSKVGSSDPNTFNPSDISRESDKDADRLTGCVVKNWLEYGENSQTIAFSPTQNMSKALVDRLNSNGITAEHIDCYHSQEERQELMVAHDKGEFKVLSCSRLLNTGYDAERVRCIIDLFPVKSVTTYVQRIGRIKRIMEGKPYSIYLDHAGNFDLFGYQEDIVPYSLDMGDKTHNEKELIKKEKKELKKRECPQCQQLMSGVKCQGCGYSVPVQEQIEDDGAMLKELEASEGNAANKKDSKEEKIQFYSELEYYANHVKSYKKGWAANQYRNKYGVWPNKIKKINADSISESTMGWIKHQRIKYAKRTVAKK